MHLLQKVVNVFLLQTLGHDTSVRVFNSVIGSIMAEARSTKSWYFVRVSGRNLSHLCVECALETHPTLVLISEEVEEKVRKILFLNSYCNPCCRV